MRHSAVDFFQLRNTRNAEIQAARLSEQFFIQNRALMSRLSVQMERDYDGKDVLLVLRSGNCVGAIPLVSPTSAHLDYGLVVQPRFPWPGIGPMLAEMGWRVSPTPLRLPLLRRSERRVPVWVLSFMILVRLKALLGSLSRKFEMTLEDRPAPRGTVNWPAYAVRKIPSARLLSVPCSFPDLEDDRLLKGAVRHAVETQLRALEGQKEQGAFVRKLIEMAQQLVVSVQGVAAYVPPPSVFGAWLRRPIRSEYFAEGIQAIEWTVEERGLAGLSDLEGIPWTMQMDTFFEAWVETVFRLVIRRVGGQMKIGRKRETTHALSWQPPYLGSQKSLVPDIWIEWESLALIVDAKYKRHWEEMQERSWHDVEEQIREQHRADLLQVLAYANLSQKEKVIACLVYPCSHESWISLSKRGRLIHRAEICVGNRTVYLWLTAVPMATAADKVALPIAEELFATLSLS